MERRENVVFCRKNAFFSFQANPKSAIYLGAAGERKTSREEMGNFASNTFSPTKVVTRVLETFFVFHHDTKSLGRSWSQFTLDLHFIYHSYSLQYEIYHERS